MRIRWSALVPVLLLLGTAGQARAEYLDWSYSWAMEPTSVTSINGLSGVTGATVSGWTTPGTTAETDVVTLFPFTTSTPTGPDDTTIPATDYDLTLRLFDNATPEMTPKEIKMSGQMWGTVSPELTEVFNKFTVSSGETVIGDYLYKVVLTKFTAPTASSAGSISAQISVEKLGDTPVPTRTPEPSALLLAGLCLPVLLGRRLRRQRTDLQPA